MIRKILVMIMLGILLLALPPKGRVLAQEPPPKEKEGVVINLAGAKLGSILNYISRREGKPLLLDPSFPKEEPINLISGKGVSIPPDKLIDVMEAILRMKGYAIIYTGPVLKVVKSIEAKTSPTAVSGIEDLAKLKGEDRIVTQIIPLEHADAMTMVSLLNQLKSREATVQPSRETNTLILTEYASNIRRLYQVIKQIDQAPAPYKTEVKQLKHTSATVLRQKITEYIGAMAQAAARPGTRARGQPRPFVTADERTNAIIIFALEDQLEQISELIDILDAEMPEQVSKSYTYKLVNTKAEEVAKIVQSIFTKQLQAMIPSGQKPEQIVSITPETTLNSLVIIAPPKVYGKMEELIKLIDIPKEQVLIETAIVELSNEKMIELGIELAAVEGPTDKGTGFGGTGFSMSAPKDVDDLSKGKKPLVSEGLTVGIWKETVGNIPFLLKAAQTDTGIDVLAVPQLVANDNTEASIDISDLIPYDKLVYGPDGAVTGRAFGGYLDAGIKLKITPHIGEDDYLRLEIEQSEEQFFKSTYSETMPAKTKRTTKTTVTVPDKDTVILGGLTRDNVTKTVKKIPLLGDIPILGWLFRWTKDEVKKTNLCIFITPHIMRKPSELIEKTEEYKEALERLRESQPTKSKDTKEE